ncbi:ABC transporter substrate-binding protein [Actinopolymorpha sp. B11F2]|uniref:ABC transporter substrate-binding protein n=1 Tax=Actinopolymorpha sp. B11F2 TaxID=3160862 RepID=UPI0032E51E60
MGQQTNHVRHGLTRRQALGIGVSTLLASGAGAGCNLLSTDPSTQKKATGPAASKGREAPMLAERVKAGTLPPVGRRLPKKPLVVEPAERIGQYGGTWRAAMLGPDTAWLDRSVGYDPVLRWRPDARTFGRDQVVPGVAESFEVNADATEYVFRFREGTRWSDGEPFTADDVLFAYDDVLRNEDISPLLAAAYLSADGPATLEKIDDYAVRVTFPAPNALFAQRMATKAYGLDFVRLPKHYLSQFHASYADNADQLAEEEKLGDWVALFDAKRDRWANPELPTLNAWIIRQPVGEGDRVVAERNPYYWKVDPDGSQLPYLDEFVNAIITDPEVMLLKATNGEFDMQTRTITSLRNKPVLAQSREKGGYEFVDMVNANMNTAIISLNLCHKDPVKREIFRNRDFRIGLSHAINRPEIIVAAYQRQGEPAQPAPRPESDFYDETLAKQYTEYDVDLANSHLDRAGYSDRDGDGLRLGPDGSPIRFSVEIASQDYGFAWASVMDLVRGYWREVGIDVNIRAEDGDLFYERKDANLFDAVVWQGDVGGMDPRLEPRYYMPYRDESNFALAWAEWYQTKGAGGEEPPAAVREQMRLYDQMAATADPAEQDQLLRDVIAMAREQFYAIGIALPPKGYCIRRTDFHNVPATMMIESDYPEPGPSNPEQYFTTRT